MADEKPIGRPLKFASVEELQTKIDAYFKEMDREEDTRVFEHGATVEDVYEEIDDKDNRVNKRRLVCELCKGRPKDRGCKLVSGEIKFRRPYTVTGLALWLDTTRQTLLEYQGEVEGREHDPRFADTITMAKARIENYASERLFDPDAPMRGVIFSLSNNAKDWTEKKDNTLRFPTDGAKELAKALMSGDTSIADDSNADDGSKESDA